MPHVAPWYRREDYPRTRAIMQDGARFPSTFGEWEKTAKKQIDARSSSRCRHQACDYPS